MMDTAPVPDGTNTANCIALIICSFLAIVSNIVPLITLIRVRNLAAVTLVIANEVSLFWIFLNPLIWHNDNQATWWNGHGLCDLEVTIRTPWYTLLSSATCRLVMDLARAVDVDNPRLFENKAMRRRRIILDVLFIFAIPFIQLCLHYLIQVQRYAIISVYGCVDFLDLSWPRIVIMSMWPLLFGLLNCWYSVVTIHRLRKHRGRLSKTLSRTGSGLDARKFLKLFLMVLVVLLLYLPILCYFFYTNWPAPFYPYSFARTHPKTWGAILYLHIAEFPAFQYWNWSPITLAFLLFFWYGITNEAINSYREGLIKIGFGKIWPILREPYTPRRSKNGSSPSRASWLNKFDMVSKAVSYMDTMKKDTINTGKNQTSSTQTGSESSRTTTASDPDVISPIPSNGTSVKKSPQASIQELECQSPVTTGPPHRTMFSAFRTHINLPFPLFSSSSTKPISPPATMSHPADLEKQDHAVEEDQHPFTTDNTVETNIWSGSIHDEEKDDPMSPKLGTRAYRERERREKGRRESREKDTMTRVVADNVRVELGLPMQGFPSGNEHGGVAVKREMVRKEEAAERSSSRP